MQRQETAPEKQSPSPTNAKIIWAKRVFGKTEGLFKQAKTRFDAGETTTLEIPHITKNLRRAMKILLKTELVSAKEMLEMGEIIDEAEKSNGSHHNGIPHPGDEFE